MPTEKRELYSSTNGDRWFPVRDFATGNVFIRHEANIPSAGRVTEIDIGTFLGGGERHPSIKRYCTWLERCSGPVLAPIIPDGDEALASARSESFAKTRPKPAKSSWKMARPADQALAGWDGRHD
jgi:hypothetical protein